MTDEVRELKKWGSNPDLDFRLRDLRNLLRRTADAISGQRSDDARTLRLLADPRYGLEQDRYPGGVGIVLRSRRQVPNARGIALPAMDDGEDETSRIGRENPVPLDAHLDDVCRQLNLMIGLLPVHDLAEVLPAGGRTARLGKSGRAFSERWSLVVIVTMPGHSHGCGPSQPGCPPHCVSAVSPNSVRALPDGFRHEMLSLQLAQIAPDRLPADQIQRDLALHLIAAHHGRARP